MPDYQVRRLDTLDLELYWSGIRDAARTMYQPAREITEEDLTELLTRLLAEEVQAWVAGVNGEVQIVFLTAIETDSLFGRKYIHVLGFHGWGDSLSVIGLYSAIESSVREFAEARGCRYAIARITDDRLSRLFVRMGGKLLPIYYIEASTR